MSTMVQNDTGACGGIYLPLEEEIFPCEEDMVMDVLRSNGYPHRIERWEGAIRQHFYLVDSTQIQAARLINILPEHMWLILSAEEQIAGRGTRDRQWESPSRVNIYVTFVLPFPKSVSEKLFFASQVASIAVARTAKKMGFHPQIKWPNDLMLNGKKVGGVLSENKTPDSRTDYSTLLIGIGLNVNMEKYLCDSVDQPVTSLSVEANRRFDKEEIVSMLYRDLRDCVQQLLDHGFATFHDELNAMLSFKGTTITVDKDDGESVKGVFVGIDEMGRMKLQLDSQRIILLQDGRIRKKS